MCFFVPVCISLCCRNKESTFRRQSNQIAYDLFRLCFFIPWIISAHLHNYTAFSHLVLLWRGAHCWWQAWFIIWAALLYSLNLMELGLHAFLPQCLCGPCELSSRSAVLTCSNAFLWLKTHFGEYVFLRSWLWEF